MVMLRYSSLSDFNTVQPIVLIGMGRKCRSYGMGRRGWVFDHLCCLSVSRENGILVDCGSGNLTPSEEDVDGSKDRGRDSSHGDERGDHGHHGDESSPNEVASVNGGEAEMEIESGDEACSPGDQPLMGGEQRKVSPCCHGDEGIIPNDLTSGVYEQGGGASEGREKGTPINTTTITTGTGPQGWRLGMGIA